MRKVFVFFVFSFASAFAASDWVVAEKDNEVTVYYDPSTIHLADGIAKVETLIDFSEEEEIDDGKIYSGKMLMEYDCKKKKRRIISVIMFSESMGNGSVITSKVESPRLH